MKPQRGFGALVYIIAALAVLGALYGLYAAVDGRGYKRGVAEKQGEWDAANRKAEALQRAREQDVSDAIKEGQARLMAAAQLAADNESKWKEAVRENRRNGIRLATCDTPQAAPGAPAAAGTAGGGVRFTWSFVRLYDGAWTGAGGQPLYAAPAGPDAAGRPGAAAPDAGSASPYGPDDLLDVHGENAGRDNACRRDYRALIEKIRAAERAWEERGAP